MLIDCGMFQGPEEVEKKNRDPFGFNPGTISNVILTHAHLDHCGRLPMLVNQGFGGHVYMTPATKDLVELSLLDAAKIQVDDKDEPLFDESDVEQLLNQVRLVKYHERFVVEDFQVRLLDAGHILGAASVVFKQKGADKTIVFSGDLGNSPQGLIRPTDLVKKADTIVMESTYGDRNHPEENPEELLAEHIATVEDSGGTLLLPTFSLERTQEVLHIIDHLKKDGKVKNKTAVFLDSPMAIRATRIFGKYPKLYSHELQKHALKDDPFDFPGLVLTQRNRESQNIDKHRGPKVIVAGSGMMSGGRILRHAARYLPQKDTLLVFVGYQAIETLGREIQEGSHEVVIDDKLVEVNGQVHTVTGLSSHAGQTGLIKWLEHIQGVKKVFLTHGDHEARRVLKNILHMRDEGLEVVLPEHGDVVGG